MDECQLYSTLLDMKSPWKVERVSLDSANKTVDIYIAHEKGSKFRCPLCRKECMVYDHLRKRNEPTIMGTIFMFFLSLIIKNALMRGMISTGLMKKYFLERMLLELEKFQMIEDQKGNCAL